MFWLADRTKKMDMECQDTGSRGFQSALDLKSRERFKLTEPGTTNDNT